MTVGKKIRAIRKSLKQTQKQLAKASGIGLNSIIRYEKGLRDPTISQLQKIAQGLGVPLVELLPEKDYGKTWLAYPPAHIDREAWTAKALRWTYGLDTDPEIITNADQIRAMNDLALADQLGLKVVPPEVGQI